MTDPVKSLARARRKQLKGVTATSQRTMPLDTTVETNQLTPHSEDGLVVVKMKKAATRRAVIQGEQLTNLAKFMSAFGILKGKGVFGDDATEFQQGMREEWR